MIGGLQRRRASKGLCVPNASELRRIVEGHVSVPLSDGDVEAFMDGEVNIVMESELRPGMTPQDLVGPHNAMMLLYGDPDGHWVCGWMDGPTFRHFDPYGEPPQGDVYPGIVGGEHSATAYQAPGGDVTTCGRHCMVRLGLRRFSDADYRESFPPGHEADRLVTLMTLQTSFNRIP